MPTFSIRIASSVLPALFVQMNATNLVGRGEKELTRNRYRLPYLGEVPHSNHRLSVHGLYALGEDALVLLVKFQGIVLLPLEVRFPGPSGSALALGEGGNTWKHERWLPVMGLL